MEKAWTRRSWLKTCLLAAGGSAFAASSLGAYSRWIEPLWVEWNQKTLVFQNLPAFWEGKTILHISDLHAGGAIDSLQISQWLTKAQSLQPDVVAITGDIVDSSGHPKTEPIIEMFPKGKLLTLWVSGNHDSLSSQRRAALEKTLANSPCKANCLDNAQIRLHGLDWIGTEDYIMGSPNPQRILGHNNAPIIALAHNPKELSRPCWKTQTGWMLCGHTHGGQVRLPHPTWHHNNTEFWDKKPHPPLGIVAPSPEIGLGLHISRGLGQHVPYRFRSRPEITLLTLEQTKEKAT